MNIAIVGSRNFNDYNFLKSILTAFINENNLQDIKIISGGAKGADSLAEQFADEFNYEKLIFKAEWNKYQRSAGPIRNRLIVENADIIFAFLTKSSRGTKNLINTAIKKGKIVNLINV